MLADQVRQRRKPELADKKLIIADGHHRYETALNYRNQMREQTKSSDPEAPYERVMMTFVNMDAPGLVILPTHRVVFGLEGFHIYSKAMEVMKYFDIEDLGTTMCRRRWRSSARRVENTRLFLL